jgi:hypothetical protein
MLHWCRAGSHHVQAVALIDEAPELIHAGLADAFGAGLPEDVGHGCSSSYS